MILAHMITTRNIMTDYRKLDQNSVLEYVIQKGFFKEKTSLSCNKLPACKANHIFQVCDENQKSIIIKQAISDTSSGQESIRIEVLRVLERHRCCPEYSINVMLHDIDQSCVVMQDFTANESLLTRLSKADSLPQIGPQLAHFLAYTLFYTSDFYLSQTEKNANLKQLLSSDCQLTTDDSSFTEPYEELKSRNIVQTSIDRLSELRQDETFKAEIAELKAKCLNTTQAFVHGNLTCEQVLVDKKAIKVINTEYAFYGPIGFDVGTILGSFLINFCTSALSLKTYERANQLDTLIQTIRDIWNLFADIFSGLMKTETQNLALQNATYQARFLRSVFLDSLGYAGCELIRQATMSSPINDFNSISDDEAQEKAKCHCIELGQVLVNKRYQFVSINDVLLEAEAIIEQE